MSRVQEQDKSQKFINQSNSIYNVNLTRYYEYTIGLNPYIFY